MDKQGAERLKKYIEDTNPQGGYREVLLNILKIWESRVEESI